MTRPRAATGPLRTARRLAAAVALAAALMCPAPGRAAGSDGSADAGDEPPQELLLQLAVPAGASVTSAVAEIQRPTDTRQQALVDDGTVAGDLALDGVFTARDRGPYARFLPVRLLVAIDGGEPGVVYEGLVRTADSRQDAVAWRLDHRDGAWSALPTAAAYAGRTAAAAEAIPALTLFGWGLLVLVTVIALAGRAPDR